MAHLSKEQVNQIYEENLDKIYKFFFFKVFNQGIAEDLTSDVFLRFVQNVKNKKEMQDPPKYLFGIVRNVWAGYLREKYRSKIDPHAEVKDFGVEIDLFNEDVEEYPTLEEYAKHYINQLPDKQRIILWMRLIDKMELKEICEKLGKDMNYVKTTQRRGIASLRKMLVEARPEESVL